MHRRLADACFFGHPSRLVRRRSRDAMDRLRNCDESLKQEPSLGSTETTNSSREGLFVPREIALQSAASRFGTANLNGRRTGPPSSCVSRFRWDFVRDQCISMCSFALQTWAILRSAYQGQKYDDRPWWKTEFARAVSFCVLFPILITTRPFLFFPILLLSGFLQSDRKVYRNNVKQHRNVVS